MTVTDIALLAALAAGFATTFGSWRQTVYPDEVPAWVPHIQVALVFGFAAAFIAAVASLIGLVNLSNIAPYLWYAVPAAFPDQYNHANDTTQATKTKDDATKNVDVQERLHVNAKQVLSIWPRTRKGSPLEAVKDVSGQVT